MIDFIKKVMQKLIGEQSHHERLLVNAEDEYLAMCCGSFNPRLLAKIKRSNLDNKR